MFGLLLRRRIRLRLRKIQTYRLSHGEEIVLFENRLQIAQIVANTAAKGPGRRFAIWVQGCPLRCPACCNPEMRSFDGGVSMTVADIIARVDSNVEGITLELRLDVEGLSVNGFLIVGNPRILAPSLTLRRPELTHIG